MNILQQKIKDEVIVLNDNACWIWQGQVSNSGYGRFKLAQGKVLKMVSAQTASYMAFIGDVEEGKAVKQKCGNRLCVNPEHLDLVEI